jgi:hypothetical protein
MRTRVETDRGRVAIAVYSASAPVARCLFLPRAATQK